MIYVENIFTFTVNNIKQNNNNYIISSIKIIMY